MLDLENRATYSRRNVQECSDAFKNTTFTCRKKAEHFNKACEIEALYELCYEKTGCCLFNPQSTASYSRDYMRAAYNIKEHTKKELDALLNQCFLDLRWELRGIRTLMRDGEVNVVD